MSKQEFQARVAELIGRGYTQRQALRVAKREKRLAHPLHKRAIARNLEAATLRFGATGNPDAFKVLEK